MFLGVNGRDRYASYLYNGSIWTSPTYGSFTVAPLRASNADCYHPFLCPPPDSGSYSAFTSASNPDERGNRLILPAGRVIGMGVGGRMDGDTDLCLYDNTGTLLNSITTDDSAGLNTSYGATFGFFTTPEEIAAGEYFATIKPGGSNFYPERNVYNANIIGALPDLVDGAGEVYRTDGGSFTEADYVLYDLFVLMDQVSEAGGGGGGSKYFHSCL